MDLFDRFIVRIGALVALTLASVSAGCGGPANRSTDTPHDGPRFLAAEVPAGFVTARVVTQGGPLAVSYFGEAGQADPFAQRDLLVESRAIDETMGGTEAATSGAQVSFVRNGRGFVVLSRHLSGADLTSIVDAMRIDGTRVTLGPGAGMQLIAEDPDGILLPYIGPGGRQVTYRSPTQPAVYTVRAIASPLSDISSLQWWGSTPSSVRGHAAWRSAAPNESDSSATMLTYTWIERPGVILQVGMFGSDEPTLLALIDSLREVSAAEWNDALGDLSPRTATTRIGDR